MGLLCFLLVYHKWVYLFIIRWLLKCIYYTSLQLEHNVWCTHIFWAICAVVFTVGLLMELANFHMWVTLVSGHYLSLSKYHPHEGDQAYTILPDVDHGEMSGQVVTLNLAGFSPDQDLAGTIVVSLTNMMTEPVEMLMLDIDETDNSTTSEGSWHKMEYCMPPGRVSLLIAGTISGTGVSNLALDNVELKGEECEYFPRMTGWYAELKLHSLLCFIISTERYWQKSHFVKF